MNSDLTTMKIIFATANNNKFKEAQNILGNDFTLIMPKELGFTEDIEETGQTIEENSRIKCQAIKEMFDQPCFADDTGLEVEALDGAPGIYSARYAGEEHDHKANMKKLLFELEQKDKICGKKVSRKARFVTVVTLYYNGKFHKFEGEIKGTIINQMIGEGGFGYDPIFVPDGEKRTIAQMTDNEKNAISHRGIAMRKLANFLKENNAT